MIFYVIILLWCLPPWIRIHMDIFGILDPDPHENLCGSETLVQAGSRSAFFRQLDWDPHLEKMLDPDPQKMTADPRR